MPYQLNITDIKKISKSQNIRSLDYQGTNIDEFYSKNISK